MIMGLRRTIVLMAALMVAASVSAVALRPTEKLADQGPKVDLEAMIPKQFGHWQVDETIIPLLPSPDVQSKLDKIYSQTLARTYVNDAGQRIMLSIAYGSDQSDTLQLHRPEVCYAAQGFAVGSMNRTEVVISGRSVPVTRLVATLGARFEPITYWATVGDEVARSRMGLKFAQLKYGLVGQIPDGLLFRVSNISRDRSDKGSSYRLQDAFVAELLASVEPRHRSKLLGGLSSS